MAVYHCHLTDPKPFTRLLILITHPLNHLLLVIVPYNPRQDDTRWYLIDRFSSMESKDILETLDKEHETMQVRVLLTLCRSVKACP